MSESSVLATVGAAPIMDIAETKAQVQAIQQIMEGVMKKDEHYGVIPGCGDKPSLLQPGAQKLALTFGFAPEYRIEKNDLPKGHREYEITCRLTHRQTGSFIGEGVGLCSSMENKYRFRTGPKELTDRQVPRAYWDLRKGDPKAAMKLIGKGNGTAKGPDGQWYITEGGGEKVENDNPADTFNTIKKMAKKRAFVDAVLTATAASDIFTQDIEDMDLGHDAESVTAGDEQTAKSAPRRRQTPTQAATGKTKEEVQAELDDARRNEAMNNQHFGTYTITEGRKREGISNGKPWTLFRFKTEEGEEFQTFDATLSDVCRNARDLGEQVKITFTKEVNGKFTNNVLQDVEILGGDETGEIIDGEDNPF